MAGRTLGFKRAALRTKGRTHLEPQRTARFMRGRASIPFDTQITYKGDLGLLLS